MLTVIGTYRDGSKVDLSDSTHTKYVPEDPHVVRVGVDGSVMGVAIGSTQVVIHVDDKEIK